MTTIRRCDACGKEQVDPRHFVGRERDMARERDAEYVVLFVEAEEDTDHFDACSWSCLADMALKKAAQSVPEGS